MGAPDCVLVRLALPNTEEAIFAAGGGCRSAFESFRLENTELKPHFFFFPVAARLFSLDVVLENACC